MRKAKAGAHYFRCQTCPSGWKRESQSQERLVEEGVSDPLKTKKDKGIL